MNTLIEQIRKYPTKITWAILGVSGLAVVVSCTALRPPSPASNSSPRLAPDEFATRYILVLGDGQQGRVMIRGKIQDFKNALPKAGWYTNISFSNGPSLPDQDYKGKPSTSISYIRIASIIHPTPSSGQTPPPDQPAVTHVTQKVGANTMDEITQVLNALKY